MDDPNITMEEYIWFEEEKAQKRRKVFNWETAKYGKIWYDEDVHDLRSVKTEFPAIVFNDNLTSDETLSCEPMVSSLNDNKIDFRISFDEFDDEDYTVNFDKNSFSYKIISANDLKTDSENDNEKVNMPLFTSPEPLIGIDAMVIRNNVENLNYNYISFSSHRTMSSPNQPTSDIKDDFPSNFHDYFPATSRNNSPNSLDDFTKYILATLVFLPLHDMEVMPAYDATDNELPIPLLQTIISLPTALPPSSVSPMFDSQNFFPPEEISPKDTKTSKSPILLSPSSSIGSSSPIRTSTSEAPTMTQAAIKKLVTDSVSIALEAQAANMENTDNTTGLRETHVERKCTHKEFMSCQPFYFNGTERAIGLIHLFERTELWKSYAKPIGIEQADKIVWTGLKRLLTNKYCPRTEVKKKEDEFYNLVVKKMILRLTLEDSRKWHFYAQTWCQILRNSWKSSSGDYPEVLKEMLPLQDLKP
nr:hypothetical protein [Tanacetum cinerariifolium]